MSLQQINKGKWQILINGNDLIYFNALKALKSSPLCRTISNYCSNPMRCLILILAASHHNTRLTFCVYEKKLIVQVVSFNI